jgi:hypothetical protein
MMRPDVYARMRDPYRGSGKERRRQREMRWIAVSIAVFAVIEWVQGYAMYYQWNLPVWLGHIAYGLMLSVAVAGIIRSKS